MAASERERVGRVLLAKPRVNVLVEPPGGLHRRDDHLMVSWIKHDPLQLTNVGPDEVEQCRAGLGQDVTLQGGEGGLAASTSSATMAGSVLIVAAASPAGGTLGPPSGRAGTKSPRSKMA
jgi:hypothetical protein